MKEGKPRFHKKRKVAKQHNEHTRSLTKMRQGQSVRVQGHVTKKWEPGIVKQKVGKPILYIITTKSGAEYPRNRRHIRTTGETFMLPDRRDNDESTNGEHEAVISRLFHV